MANQQDIIKAIRDHLNSDTGSGGVASLVSFRIFEGEAFLNETLPLVTFDIVSSTLTSTFDSSDPVRFELQVDCYQRKDLGRESCRQIADAVKARLHDASPVIANWGVIDFSCIDPGTATSEPDANRITLRFAAQAS